MTNPLSIFHSIDILWSISKMLILNRIVNVVNNQEEFYKQEQSLHYFFLKISNYSNPDLAKLGCIVQPKISE